MNAPLPCPVCDSSCLALDVVDFNKSCMESVSTLFELAVIPIYYYICVKCQFCFAPEIANWSQKDFEEKIYNKDYVIVDPDYVELRPKSNSELVRSLFPSQEIAIRHLDFGGGNGLMCELLNNAGWDSHSFDPIADKHVNPASLGKFDLITAFEVFEHVPDVKKLITMLPQFLKPEGIIIFSTLASDGHIARGKRINWWYAAPRNGHISLFSRKSLAILGAKEGFHFASLSVGIHVYWKNIPVWASHLIHE